MRNFVLLWGELNIFTLRFLLNQKEKTVLCSHRCDEDICDLSAGVEEGKRKERLKSHFICRCHSSEGLVGYVSVTISLQTAFSNI